nr:RNA-dependent RNA polymerase [Rhizoctonia zeae RNA virus 1]
MHWDVVQERLARLARYIDLVQGSSPPLVDLAVIGKLVDDGLLNALHALVRSDGGRTTWMVLRGFYADVFNGVEPDEVFSLGIRFYEMVPLPKGAVGYKHGSSVFNADVILGLSEAARNTALQQFAIVCHPLVGKSTVVRKWGVMQPDSAGLSAGHKPLMQSDLDSFILASIARAGYTLVDVDDMYDFEVIKSLVAEENWAESNKLKHEMMRKSVRPRSVMLVHSEEDAAAVGAHVLGHIHLRESDIVSRGTDTVRAHLARISKAEVMAGGKPKHLRYVENDNTLDIIYELVAPFLYTRGVIGGHRGGEALIDEATASHIKRKREATAANLADWRAYDAYTIDSASAISAVEAGILNHSVPVVVGALKALYPSAEGSISSRARLDHRVLAKCMIALADKRQQQVLAVAASVCNGVRGADIIVAASWFLYGVASVERGAFVAMLSERGYLSHGVEFGVGSLKDMHEVVRRAMVPPFGLGGHATEYMYTQCLWGRYYNVLLADDGAIDARTKFPGVHTAPDDDGLQTYHMHKLTHAQALERHRAAIRHALADCRNLTVEEFHGSFLEVASSGSAASGKAELQHLDSDARFDKRVWLNELTTEQLLSIPSMPAEVFSNAVNKVELGKIRQLLPGPVWHWLAESIVMFRIEKNVFEADKYITLEKTPKTLFQRFFARAHRHETLGADVVLDMDYADFNITHMMSDMRDMYQLIGEEARAQADPLAGTFGTGNYAHYVAQLCDWLSECFYHMYMRADGGDGLVHHLVRGLWSGWRTTQFLNTAMNSDYADQGVQSFIRLFGYRPFREAEGQGDDMDGIAVSMTAALLFVNVLQRNGHEMNGLKQLIGRTSSEYLRITSTGGGVFGNLARSIGSFCSSDLQSNPIVSGPETVVGCSSAIETLIRRGMDIWAAEVLRDVCIEHFSAIDVYNPATHEVDTYRIGFDEANISGINGGLNVTRFGQVCPERAGHMDTSYKNVSSGTPIKGAKGEGIAALKRVVSKFLHTRGLQEAVAADVADAAARTTYEHMQDKETRREVDHDRKAAVIGYYKQCRAFKQLRPVELEPLDTALVLEMEAELHNIFDVRNGYYKHVEAHDIEDIVSNAIAAAVGPMRISPEVVHAMRDELDRPLTAVQALEQLGGRGSGRLLGALRVFCVPQVVDYMLSSGGHSYMQTGGLLPAELNLLLQHIQLRLLPMWVSKLGARNITYAAWHVFMRQVTTQFMTIYKRKYYSRFRL